jgi:hypothetical protein
MVEGIASKISPPELKRIEFSVRNLGKTAAVLIEWSADCCGASEIASTPQYLTRTQVRANIHRSWQLAASRRGCEERQRGTSNFGRGDDRLLLGLFRYEDVFGRTHITGFGYRSVNNRLMPWPFVWGRHGGDAYNYDREEKSEGLQ